MKYDRRRETRQGDKIRPRYTGPFEIHESFGKGVYRLVDPTNGRIFNQKINSRDLKRFNEPSHPLNENDEVNSGSFIKKNYFLYFFLSRIRLRT